MTGFQKEAAPLPQTPSTAMARFEHMNTLLPLHPSLPACTLRCRILRSSMRVHLLVSCLRVAQSACTWSYALRHDLSLGTLDLAN